MPLCASTKKAELVNLFESRFGSIRSAVLPYTTSKRKINIYAIVTFVEESSAEAALAPQPSYRPLMLRGRKLHVRASNRSKGRLPVPPISVPLTPQEAYGSAATCINGIPREVAIPTSHSHDQSQADAQAAETATDEQSTPINILSDDLLLKVFEHLSLRSRINTERVCKRWRFLLLQSWKSVGRLSLNDFPAFGTITAVRKSNNFESLVVRCSPLSLRSLDCGSSREFDSCSSLEWLRSSLGEPSYTPQFFDLQMYQSILVESERAHFSRAAVSDGDCVLVARTARTIAAHCHQLTTLALAGCRSLTDVGLRTLGRSLSHLQKLDLSDTKIKEKSLWWFVKSNPDLREICVANCLHVTLKVVDYAFQKLAEKCNESLRSLHIGGCSNLTDATLALLPQFINLEELSLAGTNGTPLTFLSHETKFTHAGLLKLSDLRHLKALSLSNSSISTDEDVFSAILRNCTSLRALDISQNVNIPDAMVASLISLKNLEILDISYLMQLTNQTLSCLVQLSQLRVLLAKGLSNCGSNGFYPIVENCTKLALLDISSCRYMDNEFVESAHNILLERLSDSTSLSLPEHPLVIICGGTRIVPSELSAQTSGEPVILRLIERDTSDHDLLPHQFFFIGEDEVFSDDDEDQHFSDFDGSGDDDNDDDNDDGMNQPAAGWAYDWEANYFWNGDIPEWVLEDPVGDPPSPPELPAGSGSGLGGASNAAANAHHMRWVDGGDPSEAAAAAAAANADHIRWDYDGDPSEAAAAASNCWEAAAANGQSTENLSFAEWDEVLAREQANAAHAPTPSADGESTTTASPHDDSDSWDAPPALQRPPHQPSRPRAHQATNSASSATTGPQQASSTWASGARGGLASAEPTWDQWDANCSSATSSKAAARSDSHSSSFKAQQQRLDDIDDDGDDEDDQEDDVYDDQEDNDDMTA